MFGLTGAHRSGKTTLAKRAAEALGIPYFDASVSPIMRAYFAERGIEATGVSNLPLEDRIASQEHLLSAYDAKLRTAVRPSFTDRTPLDMIGYMLGEVTMHNLTPEQAARIEAYCKRCLALTREHFDTVFVVYPLPVYSVDPKSPPPNAAYQRLVHYICDSAATELAWMNVKVVEITTPVLSRRVEIVVEQLHGRMIELLEDAKTVSQH